MTLHKNKSELDQKLVDASGFGKHGYPWKEWDLIRNLPCLYKAEPEGYQSFWSVTRHADIVNITKNHKVFQNNGESVVLRSIDRISKRPKGSRKGPDLLELDGAIHATIRKILIPFFTKRKINHLNDDIRNLVAKQLNQLKQELSSKKNISKDVIVDFVEKFSAPIPAVVTCSLLGLPAEEFEYVSSLCMEATESVEIGKSNKYTATHENHRLSIENSLCNYFENFVEKKRTFPDDSLGSSIANAIFENRLLTMEETNSIFILLLIAGNDTTRHAISGGVLAFLQNSNQLDLLIEQNNLLKSAVEEVIRWTSPAIHLCRTAVEDTYVSDTKILKGDLLVLYYAAGNRDPNVFDQPNEFNISRKVNPHLGFGGGGVHHCLGATLARVELEIVFSALIELLKNLTVQGDIILVPSFFFGGIKSLPVSFKPIGLRD